MFSLVLRSLLLPALLLVTLVGCLDFLEPAGDPDDPGDFCPSYKGDYGQYDDAQVTLSSAGRLRLSIQGTKRNGHCPPAFSGPAYVNGIAMRQTARGGAECPGADRDKEYCLSLAYELNLALLPAESKTLDIAFDSVGADDEPDYAPARTWRMTVDWTSVGVWIEDDLATRVRADEEFEVHWTPESAAPPRLELSVFSEGAWKEMGLGARRVSREPGVARYRFLGPEPAQIWSLSTTLDLTDSQLLCEGFERCSLAGSRAYVLPPAGVLPATDRVAPPRLCIALPGEDGTQRYSSPHWTEFPDLSVLQLGSDMSCAGADLYFVVLGACGVCGGGKSTYVVGNRGTRAVSYSVRSNAETRDGTTLEPRQLSEPLEISFDGPLSELEIISDDDCDPSSNKAWVESIACDWPRWPPTPDWKPDDCNNICGFPSSSAP